MSLSGALGIAQSALANSAAQSALLSKNIANVSNTDYARESSTSLTQYGGGVSTGPTQRATNAALLASLLNAQSASTGQQALNDGLTSIAATLGLDSSTSTSTTTATDNSPATAIGALATALQQYAAAPDDDTLATATVEAATSLASNLNQASAAVQTVRKQADGDIATSVGTINSLLAQFQTVNTAIVRGTRAGQDVSDAQDTRDGLLKQLSNEIGITAVPTADGGTSLYTDSGATLFETTARSVAFTPTTTFTAGTVGGAVTVDGVAVTGASATAPIASGRLAGLATLRDTTATAYQNQLDQVAAGLVTAFAETATSGTAATKPGLFTSSGLTALPTVVTGLAATIGVNASYDPAAGGAATRLRDGDTTASSPYSYNATGAAGDATHLDALGTALAQTRSFDAASGGTASGSLAGFATSSVSWVEAQRQTASSAATYTSAVASGATTALSNATGVNLDDQMSQMLEIEHAYQASAQLLNTVNTLFTSLIQAFN